MGTWRTNEQAVVCQFVFLPLFLKEKKARALLALSGHALLHCKCKSCGKQTHQDPSSCQRCRGTSNRDQRIAAMSCY